MILPIYGYGFSVLKKVCEPINKDYPQLDQLIENMWETMYSASGVGLAAPQIGEDIRLFIVDTKQLNEDEHSDEGIKKVFINAQIVAEAGEEWAYEEGCLSIPFIRADVFRQPEITIEYYDEHFEKHVESLSGIDARVVQHEYDHIDGVLFVDHLTPLKKRMLKRKLEAIRKGNIDPEYRMKYATSK
ncbi:peptide deformylase [Portibacter marinus]|uniref:peptide deformylase n=1 Tax=Portibacter marinus TaxID=2898660 RepID=UPI001F22BB03|nr:peptide deformylase [Portibacter marinus]